MVLFDVSSFGFGVVFMQKQQFGEMRLVVYVSRLMIEIERRYVQIEKEVLVIIWVFEYWVEFLIGMRFKVEIDYKLLILLFFIKLIDELLVYI